MRISRPHRVIVGWTVVAALAVAFTEVGSYSLGLFVCIPLLIGALAAWSMPSRTGRSAVVMGVMSAILGGTMAALAGFFLLAIGREGLICIVMALPILVAFGMLGALLVFLTRDTGSNRRSASLLLLPFSFGSAVYDVTVVPSVYEVTTSIEIAADPQTVWQHVIAYSEMPEPTEWLFQTGIGYPTRVRLDGAGVGATRFCDFSTGSFVEPITVWEPGRRLEFDVIASAEPMKEWSPYGDIHPRHLNGYFISRKGRFVLTTLPNGHTLLEGTSWYEHGLEPGPYWRWWSDAVIHRIHRRVLTHIKYLSES